LADQPVPDAAGTWQAQASYGGDSVQNAAGTQVLGLEVVIDLGEVMQSARTSQMIFDIPRTIEFLSSFTTLRPGDVIATGTPGGVGFARQPPIWLQPGDKLEVTIEGIGRIANQVVAETGDLQDWPWVPPPAKQATL
jgi:2-keto-4-pentenoate hydratase/2-oxohepta-3-ene-1,7-dioic acid hydratase in catechol pathway